MANIKKHQGRLASPAQQSHRVGDTYGSRRANTTVLPQRAAAKQVDQFSKGSTPRRANLAQFDAGATYKASAQRFIEGKPRAVFMLEKGAAHTKTVSEVKPPSDNAIMKFLDKVISTPELENASSIRKAVARK